MGIVIILMTWMVISIPGSKGLHVMEGETATLHFPYPCDSTEITIELKLSSERVFYSSSNKNSKYLPPNYEIRNQHDIQGNNCTLHLIISPVNRTDQGMFDMLIYKNGYITGFKTTWLGVGYPPGKASCEQRNKVLYGEQVFLHCTASVERDTGQIICYQSGISIPPSTTPKENNGTINQNFSAKVLEDPVYCCSSILKQTKDMCDCKDWVWDPVHNTILTTNTDPCPSTLPSDSTPAHSPSDHLSNIHISSSSGSLIPTHADKDLPTVNDKKTGSCSVGIYIVIGIFLLFVLVLITMTVKKKKILQRTRCVSSDTRESSIAHNYSQGQTETENSVKFNVTDPLTSDQSPFDGHSVQNMEIQSVIYVP